MLLATLTSSGCRSQENGLIPLVPRGKTSSSEDLDVIIHGHASGRRLGEITRERRPRPHFSSHSPIVPPSGRSIEGMRLSAITYGGSRARSYPFQGPVKLVRSMIPKGVGDTLRDKLPATKGGGTLPDPEGRASHEPRHFISANSALVASYSNYHQLVESRPVLALCRSPPAT
ncbi:hypothetical protein BC834DRAFT_537555 [Gloeopeniophorella convolvens]|nr:hypothetical protein BC834DRAFT_537555 [Gloeopeniophorella convolvens]